MRNDRESHLVPFDAQGSPNEAMGTVDSARIFRVTNVRQNGSDKIARVIMFSDVFLNDV